MSSSSWIMTKILPSLLQDSVEFALTKDAVTLFKLVNTCYPDLLMEGAEHQQQLFKVCLYCWSVLKSLFTLKRSG